MSESIPVTRDTGLVPGSYHAWDFGGSTTLSCGGDQPGDSSPRILLWADVSGLEAGLSISNATLHIRCAGGTDSNPAGQSLHRMLELWYEGPHAADIPGAGDDASTWDNKNANGSVAWAGAAGLVAGTDYASAATDTGGVSAAGDWLDLDVTADVQDWYDGSATNYGWMLTGETGGYFHSKSFISRNHATEAYRPYLEVTMGGAPASLVVEPSTVIGLGQEQIFILNGANTAWSFGSPGMPTFGVTGATKLAQTVQIYNKALVVVQVPSEAGTITFSDPENSTEATVTVIEDTNIGADLAAILAAIEAMQTQMKGLINGLDLSGSTDSANIAAIVATLNAGAEAPTLDNVALIQQKLGYIQPAGYGAEDNLKDIGEALRAAAGVLDTVDANVSTIKTSETAGLPWLKAAIDGIDALDQDALDAAVLAIKGTDGPTTLALAALINAMTSNGANTLASVLTAVGNVRGAGAPDLAGVLTAITNVRGNGQPDLATLKTKLDSLNNTDLTATNALIGTASAFAALAAELGLVGLLGETAAGGISLASLLADVGSLLGDAATIAEVWAALHGQGETWQPDTVNGLAIKAQEIENEVLALAAARRTPAVWPGSDLVTLGTPVAFAGYTEVEAEMDGAIINLTTVPRGHGGAESEGDRPYWWRIGWYAFYDDSGHIEQPRWLTTDSLVASPESILRPAGIVISCPDTVEGTVTPWTSTA